jgi:hypothetical protein
MFDQLSVIYSLPWNIPASFTLLLPFFATGTAEMLHEEGQVSALMLAFESQGLEIT